MAAGFSPPVEPGTDAGATAGFRLLRYFTLTSLAAIVAVAGVLAFVERAENEFFHNVQIEQAAFFRQAQENLARRQAETAQSDLLRVHEAGHVNLTRIFANVLWQKDFAPFVARAQGVPIEHCRGVAPAQGHACHAGIGAALQALSGFRALDARVADIMQKSTVFKIKVFDLRGVTIYSSEHAQIGEDKRGNEGWKSAVAGQPVSELTHRDRFSAFEGVVEDRDLISSYIPVRAPGGERIVGVFEIYSDVTPFLEQIRGTTARIRAQSAENQAIVERVAADHLREVGARSNQLQAIVGALLALLFGALYLVARHGQGIIDRREREREDAIQRELRSHREKMAALGTMAANVAHEIGNPLAAISAFAEEMAVYRTASACACPADSILEQTRRIAGMTRRIADFAAARSESLEVVDINQTIKAVCDFMGFDRRFGATRIEYRADPALPGRALVPGRLTEVLMNLLQVCVEGDSAPRAQPPGRINVEAMQRGGDVLIRIDCDAREGVAAGEPEWAQGPRIAAARRIVAGMGGRFAWRGPPEGGVEIALPEAAGARETA